MDREKLAKEEAILLRKRAHACKWDPDIMDNEFEETVESFAIKIGVSEDTSRKLLENAINEIVNK